MAEYRSLCERMLERFGRTENLWVVAACTLTPKAVADLSRPVRIAEKLAARQPRNAECLAILGFALYRQGDLEGAVRRLEASLQAGPGLFGDHGPKLGLAMAYHRLGRGAEARQLVGEVTRWLEKNAREKPEEGAGPRVPLPWPYRLALLALHREAEELVKEGRR